MQVLFAGVKVEEWTVLVETRVFQVFICYEVMPGSSGMRSKLCRQR